MLEVWELFVYKTASQRLEYSRCLLEKTILLLVWILRAIVARIPILYNYIGEANNPLITCKLEIQQQSEQISDNIWTTRLTYRPTMHWNYHFCWCTSRLKAERSSPIRPVSTCHVSTVIHTSENNIYSCWNTKNTRLCASMDNLCCSLRFLN